MKRWYFLLAPFLLLLSGCLTRPKAPDIPANTWVQAARDEFGARRCCSFRFVPEKASFLLWGYHEWNVYIYGNPDIPWEDNTEYDLVAFDPDSLRWLNVFPRGRESEWAADLPPMHLSKFYHGITTGSYRTGLAEREGVLRPDLNVVYDQVTYDSKRRRMVYFTGGRTLAYDIEKREWSDIAGESSPPPVLGGSLCYDPFNDEIVLTGGGNVAERGPDGSLRGYTGTWIYSCADGKWRRLETGGTEPPPRICTRLVCDTKTRRLVLFGGDGQSLFLSDTWLYDTRARTWSISRAQGAPPPRAGHFTVYDPGTGLVIIGGGYDRDGARNDMWGYDPRHDRWRKLAGEVPTGWFIAADIDPERRLIVLTASTERPEDDRNCDEQFTLRTTYLYRLEKRGLIDETPPAPPRHIQLRRSIAGAVDGALPDSAREARIRKFLAEMPRGRWVRLPDAGRRAELRTWGSCSFDSGSGCLVYWGGGHCGYGGSEYDLYDVAANTWRSRPLLPEYPGRVWRHGINLHGVTFSGAPWTRHGRKVYAWDPVSRNIISTKMIYVTSGYNPEALKPYWPQDDSTGDGFGYQKWVTWSFDPGAGRWKLICSGLPGLDLTVTTPYGVMAVDYNWGAIGKEDRPDMTEFRGERVVDNSVYLLHAAEGRWEKLTKNGPWPQNLYEMTALVYDSKRDRLLLHGGGPEQNEIWSFSLRDSLWTCLNPSVQGGGPAPVCQREAVYLPERDLFLTWSYQPGKAGAGEAWGYSPSANAWRRLDIPEPEDHDAGVTVSQNRCVAYDPGHDLILMVLGQGGGNSGPTVIYGLRY